MFLAYVPQLIGPSTNAPLPAAGLSTPAGAASAMRWEKCPERAIPKGPEEANTWSWTELFPSACARQGRSPSAGLASVLRGIVAQNRFLGCCGVSPLRRVPEDGGAAPAACREESSSHLYVFYWCSFRAEACA